MSATHGSAGMRHRGRLFLALGVTATFMIVEAAAGFMTGSLVLVGRCRSYAH